MTTLNFELAGADFADIRAQAQQRARHYFGDDASFDLDIQAEAAVFTANGEPTTYRAHVEARLR